MTDDQKEHVTHVNALSDGGLFNKPRLPNKKVEEGLHNWDMTMETPSLQANPHLWLIFELSIH